MAIQEDKYLTYSYTEHMYYPTQELIQDKLNVNLVELLGSENEKDTFLEDIAFFIKDFCIEYSGSINYDTTKKQIEWNIFNNSQNERSYIQRAYVELARYAINDEGDLVGVQTGLNLINGQVVPISELRGKRELSSRLERILKISGVLYRGYRAWTVPTDDEYGVDY